MSMVPIDVEAPIPNWTVSEAPILIMIPIKTVKVYHDAIVVVVLQANGLVSV